MFLRRGEGNKNKTSVVCQSLQRNTNKTTLSGDLRAEHQPAKGSSSERHQGANTERKAVVEKRRVTSRRRTGRNFLGFVWVLLQVRQLETAAQQKVQELGLKGERGAGSIHFFFMYAHTAYMKTIFSDSI